MKQYILPIIAGLLVLAAVPATIYVISQPGGSLDPRNWASSPTGTVTIRLDPTSKTVSVGDTFPVAVKVDPAGETLAGVNFQLTYTYTGSTPEIEVVGGKADETQPESNLEYIENVVENDTANKKVLIKVAATKASGFVSPSEFTLATINFKANTATNGITMSFVPQYSKAIKPGGGDADILLTPTSTGTYAVNGVGGATKYKCVSNSCVVDATGTFDTKAACDATCGTSTTKKYKCSGTSCIEDAGGTYTTNTCNNACTAAAASHLECKNSSCVKVAGAGNNTGGCSTEGASCYLTHFECQSGSCVSVAGEGNHQAGCTTSGQACTLTGTMKYKCSGSYCIRDDVAGTYTSTNCNNSCGGGVGGAIATPTPTPASQAVATVLSITSIKNNQTIFNTQPTFKGKAPANASVTCTVTSTPQTATVTADSLGNWAWQPPMALEVGSHILTVTDGATTKSVSFTVSAPVSGSMENVAILLGGAALLLIPAIALLGL